MINGRSLALAYAAIEEKDWSAAAQHAQAALQAGHRAALPLLAVIKYSQSDFAGALQALEEARQAGEIGADGISRLIRTCWRATFGVGGSCCAIAATRTCLARRSTMCRAGEVNH